MDVLSNKDYNVWASVPTDGKSERRKGVESWEDAKAVWHAPWCGTAVFPSVPLGVEAQSLAFWVGFDSILYLSKYSSSELP